LGVFVGGFFTVLMMMYRVRGAIIIGILLVSIISWPRSTSITLFPHTATGDENFDFFTKIVTFRPVNYIGNALDYNYGKGKVWLALITFLYIGVVGTTGTFYSMARFAGIMDDATGDFEKSWIAYCVDGFCISISALFGTSPVTAYIESSTGIADGAKTGIAGMVTGIAFFISIFFAPIFASIPPWATGGALVITGSLMMKNVLDINWSYMGDALPSFLTIILIPFTFNVAYGLIIGIIAMVILKGIPLLIAKISNNRLVPEQFERREIWHTPAGGSAPLWMRKLARGDKKFWLPEEDDILVTLPAHTKVSKETNSHLSHEKVMVRHQIVEVPRDGKYDVELELYSGRH
jgi:AGZA family xanthine/uracil permease-like MFS transporter